MKKAASQMVEGNHSSKGHSAGKLSGTAVNGDIDTPRTRRQPESDASRDPQASSLQSQVIYDEETSNQSPAAPESSDGNARVAGRLAKQPSIVRGDWEGEEPEERNAQAQAQTEWYDTKGPTIEQKEVQKESNGTILPSTTYSGGPQTPRQDANGKASKSQSSELQSEATSNEPKRVSLSPSRSARFSAQPVLDVPGMIRHEPPARAASPAKSALKRSPSPRIPSPSGLALSEISDTTSVGSEEGASGRKKRNVRVSFDDQPIVVGVGGDLPSVANSPIIFSPQNKDPAKRLAFSFRRDNLHQDQFDEDDEGMSPRPALPSFGSIRERKEQQKNGDVFSPSATTATSDKAHIGNQETTLSSDHAVGAIIAQHAASKVADVSARDLNEPLPPEVSTVEGSGYHPNSESSDYGISGDVAVKSTEFPEEPSQKDTEAPIHKIEDIPTIAVQPATPGQQDLHENRNSWLGNMPGSFPANDPASSEPESSEPESTSEARPSMEPTSLGISKIPSLSQESAAETPEVAAPQAATPVTPEVLDTSTPQSAIDDDESDDTGNSIYSDAAEDVTDLEGNGFGSINAIVDGPIVASSPSLVKTPDLSSSDGTPSSTMYTKHGGDLWASTRSYWSGVIGGTKAGSSAAQPSISHWTEPPARELESERGTKRLDRGSEKLPRGAVPEQTTPPISPPPKSRLRDPAMPPPMKKSMRGLNASSQTELALPLRYPIDESSDQNGKEPRLPKRMRQEPKAAAIKPLNVGQTAPAPGKRSSTQQLAQTMRSGLNAVENGGPKSPIRAAVHTQISKPQTQPRPLRTLSNDSNSDSSFRRARRKPANGGKRYTMKRSMRADAPEGGRPQSAFFSSTSTAGVPARTMRQRPMSTTGTGMRSSLRGSSTDNPPAQQSQSFGFGKRSRPANKSRRFSDSSDEGGAAAFRSRFSESSDEDEPVPKLPFGLTPVRGIPKRIDEGDSTDLEDSDRESKQKTKPKPQPAPSSPPQSILANKTEGSALASGSLRNRVDLSAQPTKSGMVTSFRNNTPGSERKRSIFGALGRKKDKNKFKLDAESAARRDTPLERANIKRRLAGQQAAESPSDMPPIPPSSPPPSRGKLQRRVTPQRLMSDSWPLPPPIPESPVSVRSEGQRPRTSDGSVRVGRPSFGHRGMSAMTNSGGGGGSGGSAGVVSERTGKKKRFPMLRKAVGLHD